jgi:hypothetical protein
VLSSTLVLYHAFPDKRSLFKYLGFNKYIY